MDLPYFKYQPNLENNDILIHKKGICQCCGREVDVYVDNMFSIHNISCICLDCVKSGEAAKKFDGEFVEIPDKYLESDKVDELLHRTPGYIPWQVVYWLSCCNDYCQYIGRIGSKELLKMPDADEIIKDYISNFPDYKFDEETIRTSMTKSGWCNGYLFFCPTCKRHHLYVDCD